ncbi:MAG: leucine-rich repeat domain-containing protein [Bacteroidetes bacterium]|nr:leucine-rich repeat domain-containing protein [Bacteroidota bacterium]
MNRNLLLRVLVMIAISFFCSKNTSAQKGLAFSGGVQHSRILTVPIQALGTQNFVDLDPAYGFAVGFDYRFGLNRNLDLKLGLRYSYRNSTSSHLEYRYYYLEYALSPIVRVYKDLWINVGMQLDNLNESRIIEKRTDGSISNQTGNMQSNRLSFFLGINYDISKRLAFEIKYTLPFKNMDYTNLYAGFTFVLMNPMKSPTGKFTNLNEAIANANVVTDLILQRKGLTVFPLEILEMPELSYLYLNGNQLSALPDDLGKLMKLKHLFAANNKIGYLPPQLGNLKALEELDLSYNRLSQLPDEIGELISLKFLKLNDNNLTELPQSIMKLQNLIELDVSNNAGLLRLPQAINLLGNLETLIVDESTVFPIPFSPANPRMEIIVK